MADVLMRHVVDGGEITIEHGTVLMQDGPATAVYLSLFGGEGEDRGTPETESKTWWGNRGEADSARWYRSETQDLLRNAPITSATTKRVEAAAVRDLAWMTAEPNEYAESVVATCTIPARNRLRLLVEISIAGQTMAFTFTETRA